MASAGRILIAAVIVGGAHLGACAAPPSRSAVPAGQQSTTSILASSSPAGGSTVRGPINELKLHFNPPARLDEIAINGPDGLMPMMIHPIGEVPDYSLPLPGLGAGAYQVNWRATAQGREERGTFGFTVK